VFYTPASYRSVFQLVTNGSRTGWFYQYNEELPGCDPPWAILAYSEAELDAYKC